MFVAAVSMIVVVVLGVSPVAVAMNLGSFDR